MKKFKKIKYKVQKMARRKRYSKKRSFKSGSSISPMKTLVTGGIYGAGRETISGLIQPLTSMMPFGDYNDEITLGVAGYFASKGTFGNNAWVKEMGRTVLAVESYRAGANAMGGASLKSSSSGVGTSYQGWQ
jgi:hypothetical protein